MKKLVILSALFLCTSLGCLWGLDFQSDSDEGDDDEILWENVSLVKKGSFEGVDISMLQELWKLSPPSAKLDIDSSTFLSGKSSLRVEGMDDVELSYHRIPVPTGAVSITGSVGFKGDVSKVIRIIWFKGDTVLREDIFEKKSTTEGGWERNILSEKTLPEGSTHLAFKIEAHFSGQGNFWIDEVNIVMSVEQVKEVEVFVNQVGYDLACPKRFVVATNFKPQKVVGAVINSDNNEVAKVAFSEPKRVRGKKESDWGKWFIRGDFTGFDQEGLYKICVWVDNKKHYSPEFLLGRDVIWEKTIPVVLNGIKLHRCGVEVSGVHQPCHLDDSCNGKLLVGGWHNGYDYGKDKTALVLNLLAEAYLMCKWRLATNFDLDKAFQEELMWGAKYILGRFQEGNNLIGNIESKSSTPLCLPEEETDGVAGNEDDRSCSGSVSDEQICASALAYLGCSLSNSTEAGNFLNSAEKLTISLIEKGEKGNLLFNSLVFLGEQRGYEKYLSNLKALYPEDLIESVEAITRYSTVEGEISVYRLSQTLKQRIESYIGLSEENPFGICPRKEDGDLSFFILEKDKKLLGINEYVLRLAQLAGKAFKFYPHESVRAFFFDQINWLLGVNPFGVSMIKGVGTKSLATYAHPYVRAGISSEQMVGCIPYGIRAISQDIDAPYIDLTGSNSPDFDSLGVSVDMMALYLNAMAQYYRVRVHAEGRRGLEQPSLK
ncbi:MAG: glycoside hydrolase family 9 protein [Candidatus Hydrogenedentes bacterium]|nr:glycoside hydrolase family 9 protein [Candidatus Hydrogenedentota bacterium]